MIQRLIYTVDTKNRVLRNLFARDKDDLEGYDSYDPDTLIYPQDDSSENNNQDDDRPDLSDMWWI